MKKTFTSILAICILVSGALPNNVMAEEWSDDSLLSKMPYEIDAENYFDSTTDEESEAADNGNEIITDSNNAETEVTNEDSIIDASKKIISVLENIADTLVAIVPDIAGDINNDKRVNNKDSELLFKYVAGWDVDVDEYALDVNGDGVVNNKDTVTLFRYLAGWPDITLHRTEKYPIAYSLYDGKEYLTKQTIENPNPDFYTTDGLTLKNLYAEGYKFEGWYDGEGENAKQIKKIEPGTKGEIELYARWSERVYSIYFDSELVPVQKKEYTIETGATLENPMLSNYEFIGWSDKETGKLVKSIPVGQTGNLTLYANWASKRNKTKPVEKLKDPIILEDPENGVILFTYELGQINNVPLFTKRQFASAGGVSTTVSETHQTSVSESNAKTIRETVAQATTNSTSWTLADGWNDSTSVNEESYKETGMTKEQAETKAKSSSNNYRLDSSYSESDIVVDESNYSYKIGRDQGQSSSNTEEKGQKFDLSVDGEFSHSWGTSAEIGGEADYGVGKVNGKVGTNTNNEFKIGVGVDYGNYKNTSSTTTNTWNDTLEAAASSSKTNTNSKNWNNTSSFGSSNSVSNSQTISEALSEVISNKYGYGRNYSKYGSHSEGQAFSCQDSSEKEYSNTVTYDKTDIVSETIEFKTDGVADGYYREIEAGTAHVFGVVGYDIATSSYFTYTFTVMDDETHPLLDYSRNDPNFRDKEIGVLPFEIPFFVNEYVNNKILRSKGLEIQIKGETGTVTGYSGESPMVVIPSYISIDNKDGTYSSVKITAIDTNAFRNNNIIQGVILSDYITSIPNYAFENCENLKDIYASELTSIGDKAFSGCISLSTLTVPSDVTSLGNQAFENVEEVKIVASSKEVALSAVNSGAHSIVLNIAGIASEMENQEIIVPSSVEKFEIQGERKRYTNLRVKSDAFVTRINGIKFEACQRIPIEVSSDYVYLNQVTAYSSEYCLLFKAANTKVSLFGTVEMSSSNENTVLCKGLELASDSLETKGVLNISGNVYVCGELTGANNILDIQNGEIIYISEEDYEKYIMGTFKIIFDANGGAVSEESRVAYCNTALGTLPEPRRDYYNFLGWYTAKNGDDTVNRVSSNTKFSDVKDIVLYAHWELKPESSNWIRKDQLPSGAAVTSTKYTYTHRSYTTSTNNNVSGWVRYNEARTGWGDWQGPVYSNPNNGSRNVRDESYVTSSNYKTVWHYFRYSTGYTNKGGSDKSGTKYGSNYYSYDLDHELTEVGSQGNYAYGMKYYYNGVNYITVWKSNPLTTQEWVSDNYGTRWYYQEPIYTYYFYKDESRESLTYPGTTDNSNIVEWVKYRDK